MKKNTLSTIHGRSAVLLFCFFLTVQLLRGQISGSVFNDYNQNGTQQLAGSPTEAGVLGVKVLAFSATNVAIDSALTIADGTYTLATVIGNVRIEFRYPAHLFPTYGSITNNTVRMAIAPATGVNLGLHTPSRYCNATPDILVNCYVFGNQISGTYKDNEVLLTFPYTAGANATVNTPVANYALPASHTYKVAAKELGPTWGIGYRKSTREVFTGAAMKRHMGFGPGGSGAIYKLNYTPGVAAGLPTVFATLPTGADPHDATNFLKDYKNVSGESYINTHDAVGKLGIGDIELIEDPSNPANDKVFAVNLYDRKLYQLNANSGVIESSYSGYLSLPGAAQGCPAVDVRPFGIGRRDGKMYIGLVCTGESTNTWPGAGNGVWDTNEPLRDNGAGGGTADDNIRNGSEVFKDIGVPDRTMLRAYIYQYDPKTGHLSGKPSVEWNLNFMRGCVGNGNIAELQTPGPCELECDQSGYRSARWNPWSQHFKTLGLNDPESRFIFTQPAISDIEFDDDNNMIISLWDRGGFQGGNQTQSDSSLTNTQLFQGQTAGDIHIAAFATDSTWTLENNGTSNGITTGGASDGVGPGGGEYFYHDGFPYWQGSAPPFVDFVPEPNSQHQQIVIGGLVTVPGSGEVMIAVFDPIPVSGNFEDQGVHIYDISDGELNRAYRVVDGSPVGGMNPGPSAKDAGLGDLEALCNSEAVELGNYVWLDADKDGVQDPGETALQNVNISLFNAAGLKVGTTTTDANGLYKFNDLNVDTTGANGAGGFTGLRFGKNYYIVIGEGQFNAGVLTLGSGPYKMTTANATVGNGNDENDSDATVLASGLPASLASLAGFPAYSAIAGGSGGNKQMFDAGFKTPSCEIYLTTNISNCFDSNGNTTGGSSVATVQAIVDWSNNPSGETINVTCTGAASQNINPATATKPAVLTFQVPADGAALTIAATFSTTTTCTATQNETAPAGNCLLTPCQSGNTGGQVWQDFDGDGVQDAGETAGIGGVTVTAFDCNGNAVATTTTDYLGQYTFGNALTFPNTYRIEFSGLPANFKPTANGTDGKTDVQFITAAECDVDFGANDPADFCQTNPKMAVNCYVNGNNSTGTSGAADVLVKFDYNNTGTTPGPTSVGIGSQAGTTWGLAYQKTTGKLFSSAYLKRHTGFGPLGTGGIYVTDIATGATTSFVNLNGIGGISTGTDPHTDLVGDKTAPSRDSLSFHKIGKVSFGDLDISDDGKTLFVVNLNSRQIHKIFINSPAVVPTASEITSFNIPNPCGSDDYRPFGLKYHEGKLYVGLVCSGESTQDRTDLQANIYEMDATTGVFGASPVLSFPLDFTRGRAWKPTTTTNKWFTWLNDWTQVVFDGSNSVYTYPQPMLSDIEFDLDGAMVLGFRDRLGDQLGVFNYFPNGNLMGGEPVTGGDIMRAAGGNGHWLIESNGVAGNLNSGAANGQGIGGSEFYKGDAYSGGEIVYGHEETSNGGLAILPGSGEVAMTALDPQSESAGFGGYNSAGIRFLSNTNGAFSDGYTVYDTDSSPGTFQKSGGLGDVEIFCSPAPLQIGNYVWIDTDKDGTQDPCETALAGVKVALYKDISGTLTYVANTTTGANGEYYFTGLGAAGENWTATSGTDSLLPNMDYKIVFGWDGTTAQFAAGNLTIAGTNYQLTDADSGEGTNPDQNDSDASLMTVAGNSYPSISLTTGDAGSVNHTYDAGFKPACVEPSAISLTQTAPTCVSGVAQNDGKITLTAATNADKYGVSVGATYSGTPNYAAATAISLPQILQNSIPNAGETYTIRIFNGADDCFKDSTITVAAVPCVPPPCPFTPTIVSSSCHSNATENTGFDDYITFLLKPHSDLTMAGKKYSVTATQGGNPIGVTLSDGTPASGIYFGYDNAFKTANGTAGQGDITLTLTASNGCNTTATVTLTDPGTCSTIAGACASSTVIYTYRTPFQLTDLNQVPLELPKFDDLGGTRTLTAVELTYSVGIGTNIVSENRAATAVTANIKANGDVFVDLDANNIFSASLPEVASGVQSYPANVLVPPGTNGSSWPGDSLVGGLLTTVPRMLQLGLENYLLSIYVDPTQNDSWVTNITGLATTDDDIRFLNGSTDAGGNSTYSTPATVAQFIGTGLLGLSTSTLTGLTVSGGGGNLLVQQHTKAFAEATVSYTYTMNCCVQPTAITLTQSAPTCNGGTPNNDGKITLTAVTGADKFGVSTGATYSGTPDYAAATAIGSLPQDLQTAIPNAGATYTIRFFNGADDCFKDSTVTVAPKICAPACCAASLMTNGSFENGSYGGTDDFAGDPDNATLWPGGSSIVSDWPTDGGFWVEDPNKTTDGSRMIWIKPDPLVSHTLCAGQDFAIVPSGGMSSVGTLVEGKTYKLCFDYAAFEEADPNNLTQDVSDMVVELGPQTLFTIPTNTVAWSGLPAGWQHFSDEITIPAGSGGSLRLLFSTNPTGRGMLYDNVTLCETVTVCTQPTALTLTKTAPTCTAGTANNDGKITLTAATNADKYGVSTGATYSGTPDYAAAIAIGSLPQDLQTAIPNAGATYTIRLFNGSDACYKDTTVTVSPVVCTAPCSITVVSATPSACNPATNSYSLDVVVNYSNPPTGSITVSTSGGATSTVAQTGSPQTVSFTGLNSDGVQDFAVIAEFVNDANCKHVLPAAYDAPVTCQCDTTLSVTNAVICNGSSVNLFAQTSGANGILTYSADGISYNPLLNPTLVSPIATTDYFIKDSLSAVCVDIDLLKITVAQPVNAGSATNNPPTTICMAATGLPFINLYNELTGEDAGGTWAKTSGPAVGINFDANAGTLDPNGLTAGSYVFQYTMTGIAPCPNDSEPISIVIQDCSLPCPPKICLPVKVEKVVGGN